MAPKTPPKANSFVSIRDIWNKRDADLVKQEPAAFPFSPKKSRATFAVPQTPKKKKKKKPPLAPPGVFAPPHRKVEATKSPVTRAKSFGEVYSMRSPKPTALLGRCASVPVNFKSVSFSERDQIREIEALEDIPESVILNLWWSEGDYIEMRQGWETVLYFLESDKPVCEETISARGLHKRTDAGAWKLYECQRDARNAVFEVQELQKKEKRKDADEIAAAYLKHTFDSKEEAVEQGALDAKDVVKLKRKKHKNHSSQKTRKSPKPKTGKKKQQLPPSMFHDSFGALGKLSAPFSAQLPPDMFESDEPSKKVKFNDDLQYIKMKKTKDIEKAIKRRWISEKELKSIENSMKSIVKSMEKGVEVEETEEQSTRGLENNTKKEKEKLQGLRQALLDEILVMQETLNRKSHTDVERLAEACRKTTEEARKRAIKQAKQDARDAKKHRVRRRSMQSSFYEKRPISEREENVHSQIQCLSTDESSVEPEFVRLAKKRRERRASCNDTIKDSEITPLFDSAVEETTRHETSDDDHIIKEVSAAPKLLEQVSLTLPNCRVSAYVEPLMTVKHNTTLKSTKSNPASRSQSPKLSLDRPKYTSDDEESRGTFQEANTESYDNGSDVSHEVCIHPSPQETGSCNSKVRMSSFSLYEAHVDTKVSDGVAPSPSSRASVSVLASKFGAGRSVSFQSPTSSSSQLMLRHLPGNTPPNNTLRTKSCSGTKLRGPIPDAIDQTDTEPTQQSSSRPTCDDSTASNINGSKRLLVEVGEVAPELDANPERQRIGELKRFDLPVASTLKCTTAFECETSKQSPPNFECTKNTVPDNSLRCDACPREDSGTSSTRETGQSSVTSNETSCHHKNQDTQEVEVVSSVHSLSQPAIETKIGTTQSAEAVILSTSAASDSLQRQSSEAEKNSACCMTADAPNVSAPILNSEQKDDYKAIAIPENSTASTGSPSEGKGTVAAAGNPDDAEVLVENESPEPRVSPSSTKDITVEESPMIKIQDIPATERNPCEPVEGNSNGSADSNTPRRLPPEKTKAAASINSSVEEISTCYTAADTVCTVSPVLISGQKNSSKAMEISDNTSTAVATVYPSEGTVATPGISDDPNMLVLNERHIYTKRNTIEESPTGVAGIATTSARSCSTPVAASVTESISVSNMVCSQDASCATGTEEQTTIIESRLDETTEETEEFGDQKEQNSLEDTELSRAQPPETVGSTVGSPESPDVQESPGNDTPCDEVVAGNSSGVEVSPQDGLLDTSSPLLEAVPSIRAKLFASAEEQNNAENAMLETVGNNDVEKLMWLQVRANDLVPITTADGRTMYLVVACQKIATGDSV